MLSPAKPGKDERWSGKKDRLHLLPLHIYIVLLNLLVFVSRICLREASWVWWPRDWCCPPPRCSAPARTSLLYCAAQVTATNRASLCGRLPRRLAERPGCLVCSLDTALQQLQDYRGSPGPGALILLTGDQVLQHYYCPPILQHFISILLILNEKNS